MARHPPTIPTRSCAWQHWFVAACLLLACSSAAAAVRMHAKSLSLPGVTLTDVHIDASLGSDGRPQLTFDAANVSVPALGWHNVSLSLTGEPRQADGSSWKLVGHVKTHGAPGGAMSDADITIDYEPGSGTLAVDVKQAGGTLDALMPLDQMSHVQASLTDVPLVWLRGVLATVWPDGRVDGGGVGGTVVMDLAAGDTRISGRVDVADADIDSRAGNIAAKKLGADGSFRIATGHTSTGVMFDGTVRGGQVLLGPLYAKLPSHAANLHVSATLGAAGIDISSLDYDDADALRLSGSLGFDRKGSLDKLDLTRFAATFPVAYKRYGTTFVEGLTGLKQLETSGSVVGSLSIAGSGLEAFDLTAEDLSLGNASGSLSLADLNGKVDWSAHASRPATNLSWDGIAMYDIAFGPAQLALEDEAGALTLRAPAAASVLGGSFQLDRFAWRPNPGKSRRLSLGFSVTNVDLPKLCKAFGWPAFGGKLGGAVPDLSYQGHKLVFGGGLSLNVFGGAVSITNLSMLEPFGSTPEADADIHLQQLNLAQLTDAFDFGEITGRLNGEIRGLKLVDWKPVAFTANLTSDGGGKISQDAIKSLTNLGGGGIAGGLQGLALRLFKTFGYSRMGLSCTLKDGVCTMGGVTPDPDKSADAFTIVEGSGLPHITVIGHERAVDWATLVSRLKAATEGSGPVIK